MEHVTTNSLFDFTGEGFVTEIFIQNMYYINAENKQKEILGNFNPFESPDDFHE